MKRFLFIQKMIPPRGKRDFSTLWTGLKKPLFWACVLAVLLFCVLYLWSMSVYFRLSPVEFAKTGLRVVAIPVLSVVYHADTEKIAEAQASYQRGQFKDLSSSPVESWRALEAQFSGFRFLGGNGSWDVFWDSPFVYESIDAPYLVEFREYYQLQELVKGAADEYDAMLRLGAWLGVQWDHGSDPAPGGAQGFEPIDVIQAGNSGTKFWCEVAARVTIQAATALGWPARLVSASRDGYRWEHALAELWSNQHQKWFVMDTDFNVVYEEDGIPLSAYELCHDGPKLQQEGRLQVRRIAEPKPSLPPIDLLPFYRYVHIDLRNDWKSRPLSRGSPAGGDLATWWTARPSLWPVLTANIRHDDRQTFDWPVNAIGMYARTMEFPEDKKSLPFLHVNIVGYSPFFDTFEYSFDGGSWESTLSGHIVLPLSRGTHSLKARIMTRNGWQGPIYEVLFKRS